MYKDNNDERWFMFIDLADLVELKIKTGSAHHLQEAFKKMKKKVFIDGVIKDTWFIHEDEVYRMMMTAKKLNEEEKLDVIKQLGLDTNKAITKKERKRKKLFVEEVVIALDDKAELIDISYLKLKIKFEKYKDIEFELNAKDSYAMMAVKIFNQIL